MAAVIKHRKLGAFRQQEQVGSQLWGPESEIKLSAGLVPPGS